MILALGCIADDYTGASDLANTLTRAGLRTVQTIGVPANDLALPEVDAVVVSLKSRSIDASVAVSRSRAAETWLRGRGAGHVLFKICSTFDSTDAGNIGPVMDALRAECGESAVLVTPAFPETGRTVYQGNLFVGAVPLNESPLKDHPLNPMHDSNLVRVLARQSKTQIGLVDLATVSRGADAVRARLAELADKGIGAAIIDAVFDRDLETIGLVAAEHRLSVGASGIGLGLARALVSTGKVKSTAAGGTGAAVGGPAACLAGSCSQATLQQIANAERVMPVLHLDPEQIVAGGGEAQRALAWARPRLADGPVLIASSATPEAVAAVQARHGRDAAGHAIEQAMADIAEGLVQAGVRRLIVAGGETSGSVVDRLRIPGFLVGVEIAAGVPVLRAVGAETGEMLLALKSGNFGGPEFFTDALKLMR
ncbi:four-carbon acid sugar kinase family protein [Bradyrhizobium sp. 182]|uniref:3-oxo-tetronate kinase n=1 Tax=unclassified Bradyrhizobium TaxID=2631580 RepID=UPI001FFBC272|nr:four-carbon acid sugar kinase family protein [Bradyrhizobium sp. CW12]MCK1532747.1 four-carbon acid sugar kinase family protein [Bradyrhizobium sp. 182]MCK1620549.1 four-carbon acid sugar kinase family protein [Bradyrhizobium sp. 159]MCK1644826.1 four-carbon acid sugar kinase family protein [Bradyrhizobium sp. 154]MCK1663737.1 four-carbon acid sugar kinase family protein [Bradyrhizobium sp. 153]MCK1759638.1 four-carbon acid sugar kinase family protein [Bradyrhizobium sp. 137]